MRLMRGALPLRKEAGQRPAYERVTLVSPVAAGVMTFVFILVVAGIGLGLLYTLSYRAHFRLLRDNLGVLARIAASQMDGDLHRRITRPDQVSSLEYDRAVESLVRIHNSDPDIHYLYTERYDGRECHFMFWTRPHGPTGSRSDGISKPSAHGAVDQNGDPRMLPASKRQERAYVYKGPEYGTFLTASAPFGDSTPGVSRWEPGYSTESLESVMKEARRPFLIVMVMCFFSICGGISAGFITKTSTTTRGNAGNPRKSGSNWNAGYITPSVWKASGSWPAASRTISTIYSRWSSATSILPAPGSHGNWTPPFLLTRRRRRRSARRTGTQMLAYTGKDRIEPEPVMLNTLSMRLWLQTINFKDDSDRPADPTIPIIRGVPAASSGRHEPCAQFCEAIGENEGQDR